MGFNAISFGLFFVGVLGFVYSIYWVFFVGKTFTDPILFWLSVLWIPADFLLFYGAVKMATKGSGQR